MRMYVMSLTCFLALTLTAGCAAARRQPAPRVDAVARAQVARALDDFHDAASNADERRYFARFAPEGVFLGTDITERWDVAAFRAYARPHFARGKGWTYRATERHVELSPDGTVAWFDELLANESYGPCRGTGVLRLIDGAWRVAQYNLTIPIPNELAKDVVRMIRTPTAPGAEK